jgi:uncharacterized protein YhaN
MKVRDIQIDGFGVWSGLSVDSMPEGMTVFYGPNEAGKTTLMNFLRTMFYGFTAERRQRYLPPVYPGKPGGAMRVSGPGGGYEIARRATLNDPSIIGQLTVTSSDGVTQGQHRLTSLLGSVDESIFTNVFAIGLRELQELSTLDDTAAADELYKLSSGLDRVSLVDVMRQLKSARGQLVANDAESGQMASMLAKREKLRDELEQLTTRGRRWGELAAHRKNQQNEIDELKLRVEQWELEAKAVETALQVRDPWTHRDNARNRLKALNARVDLPENAVDKLREIQEQIEDKRRQIQAIKEERKQVRRRASDMPVSKGILSLAGKIEAAGEQGPWIASLQKQIQRLESEVSQTQEQLVEDAKRLGLSEADQTALLHDKRLANMPDLSRQAISQLAGPARDVRSHQARLKQAKQQGINDKREADRLASEINGFLSVSGQEDLQKAHKHCNELLLSLRKSQNLEERIDKLVKHKREIETDAVSLESDEGLPIDHVVRLAPPFILGSIALVLGLGKFFGWQWTASTPVQRTAATLADAAAKSQAELSFGLLLFLFGIAVLVGTYFFWKRLEQGSRTDLSECDSRLEAMNVQLRKTEEERNELLKSLPEHGGSLEQRIREAEHELEQCESYLPVYHNWQAAMQRYRSAKQQGAEAIAALKSARNQWKKTLTQLGLADSLSPKSIRILAEGYESLLQTKRRLKTQQDELDQRKLELSTSLQRIEALSMQLKVAIEDANNDATDPNRRNLMERVEQTRESSSLNKSSSDRDRERREGRDRRDGREQRHRDEQMAIRAASAAAQSQDSVADGPILKLQELSNTLAQHQQYITQRKQLRLEDEELARKQKSLQRLMDRWIRARQSHLAELGVEDQQQLEDQLSLKHQYLKLQDEIADLDSRIASIIGGHVPYDSIARLLENAPAGELEKRWETLGQRVQQAEERVSQLLQRQGETSQEMKSLAADRRLAEAKLELASLEKQIAACGEHWRTLGATTSMLEKVCEVYETERQPETLREASAFLKQLTDGKYVRVWTPLGKNALRIDNDKQQSLPLEVLSRGTREAVFIALRLSLAAAYSRRGVTLPLVLDDVLVNFDSIRAHSAAKVLRDFASLGHQVVMFTCHEHIMKMFHNIGVQVRVLPAQGQRGEARIYQPHDIPAPKLMHVPDVIVEAPVYEEDPQPLEEPEVDPVPLPVPVTVQAPPAIELPPPPLPVVAPPEPQPVVIAPPAPLVLKPKRQPMPKPIVVETAPEEPIGIDRLWYDYDEEPAEAITQRLWTEIDQWQVPVDAGVDDALVDSNGLEGEPHDVWWSTTKGNRR